MKARDTVIAGLILTGILAAAAVGFQSQQAQRVTFATSEQLEQDACVPSGAYVKDLITQRVDQIIQPECD